MRFGDPEPDVIAEVFADICGLQVDDGIEFDTTMDSQHIREADVYGGVRVKITARLAGARIRIQVDIGIGDEVHPAPGEIEFPTLLDSPPPTIRAYRFETAIAEKFEAMVKLGMSNSRMKDFYDIYILARDFEFDGKVLQTSIGQTFARRHTPISEGLPLAWTDTFSEDEAKQTQWLAFLRKSALDAPSLTEVVLKIRHFLNPIWYGLQQDEEFSGRWIAEVWEHHV